MRNKAHVIHQRQEEDAEDIEALLCVPLIWPHEDVLTPDLKRYTSRNVACSFVTRITAFVVHMQSSIDFQPVVTNPDTPVIPSCPPHHEH
jgi:hypothetical protein